MVKKQSKGVIARVLVRSNLFFIFFLSLIFLTTCGGYDHEGTSGTGNIAFKIDWQGAPTTTQKPNDSVGQGFSPAYAPLDCTAAGVSTVSATAYSSSNVYLAEGGPWNCSDHSGYIYYVAAGSNRKVVVEGKNSSGSVLYRGEQTGIIVVDGQMSSPVTVTVTPYTPTSTATTVTDIDGNVYNMVTIGTQVWMKENLKVTKYRNGDAIPTTTADISAETSPKYQWAYSNNESNAATYGRLYTWYAATDSRGLCPTGWHLPTDTEWTTLTNYLGGESVAGGKMKEAGTTHWSNPNIGADNSSGFTALPGGYRNGNGTFGGLGNGGYWWSATENGTTYGWLRGLGYNHGNAHRDSSLKNNGLCVRCVRD